MTDLTPAEERAGAWRDYPRPCRSCGETQNHRCITSSGERTSPHAPRIYDFRAFLLGQATAQAENEGLAVQVASLRASNDQLDSALATADSALDIAGKRTADLQTALTAAQTGLAKALSDKAALDVLFTNLSASDTALRAQVAALQAQIVELTKPEPPAPATTLFGMNVSPGTSFTPAAKETAADQVKRIVATYGDLDVAKVFYGGALPAAFNVTYEGLVPGRRVLVCFKSFTVANLKSYLASIPAGWVVTLVYWQEPDDEIWVDKTLTIAAYTISVTQVRDTVAASAAGKDGRARAGQCFMEYSLTSGRWTDAVVVPGCELIWDAYWNTSAGDPSARIKAMHAVATRLKSPAWGIGEMGDRRANTTVAASMQKPTFASGADRATFWAKVVAALVAEDADYACYFNAIGTTGDHRLIPGEAYSDPTVAVVKRAMAAA